MRRSGHQFVKFIFILLSFTVLRVDVYGQTDEETEYEDSTHHEMTEEGGKNYAPAYYYYVNSLLPTTVEQTLIDTSVFNPYNEDISLYSRNLYATLGIFGQANYSMNFSFYRRHGFTYKTLPYNTYLRTIENWRLFLPEGVYTNLQYNFSNVKENHFSVTHAQKISDDLLLNVGLETVIAEGRYVMQKIRNVNFGTSLRYNLPSKRYGFAAYYFLNLIKNQENGGIANDSEFEKGERSPSEISVRFSSNVQANNHLFQNTVFIRHYLSLSGKRHKQNEKNTRNTEGTEDTEDTKDTETTDTTEDTETEENTEKEPEQNEENTIPIKKKIGLGYLVHDFEFNSSKNIFNANDLDFPPFIPDTMNYFKNNYHILRNTVFWSSYLPDDTMPDRKNFIRLATGIMHTFINVKDTITKGTSTMFRYRENQLTPLGNVYIKLFNRLHIKANALITLNGYNAGDITIDGIAALDLSQKEKPTHQIQFKLAFYNYSPDYFFTYLIANDNPWKNDLFNKQQTIKLGAAWEYENYSIGLNYYTLNNYTLLNEDCQPEQVDKLVNVYQIAAYIPFHIKGFGIHSNLYLQYADSGKLQIPVFVTRQTVYYGFYMFKKAMYLQVGIDFMYNTAYYANAYNPVLQQFYFQNDKEIGNYPYLDAYIRIKINRFQFSVKGTHLWAGLLGYNYYLVPHYPAKNRGFALGILWNFYD